MTLKVNLMTLCVKASLSSEDFPGRVMKARNNLRKFLRDALQNNKKACLKYDKLIIEGEAYEYDSTLEDIVAVGK